LTDMVNIFIFA